ncbi:VUT family protein [Paracoccus pacificus]|uniref:Probable queuosine precursor transporter n=1 Tax=Paracoccus pacificus TaxID=1463598 RepID=A0ABW4RC87_9RHOB
MTRFLPGIIAMAIVVVASNILVQFRFGESLTWGAFTYPFAFLVTDIVNRVHGPAAARRVVVAGFVVGLICSAIAARVDATTTRIAVASGLAFLLAQFLDIGVFNRLRDRLGWWKAPLFGTIAGSVLDTLTFFSVAFASAFSFINPAEDVAWANEAVPLLGWGPLVPVWLSLGAADFLVKLAIGILALVPFRIIVRNMLDRRATRIAEMR